MRKPYILPFVSALCLLPISGLFAQEEPLELEWPRTYSWSDGAKLVLYQPQITAWEEYAKIESRLALAFHSPGEGNPALGTYRLTADSDTNLETRLVRLTNLQVSEGKFPQIPRGDVERVRRRVLEIVPTNAVVVSLDRIIANLERSQSALQEGRILPDPPKILVSSKSAILVIFDGKPIWAKVPENELQFGVNTNWDIFFRKKDGSYYLLNGDYWIKSPSLAGPWSAVGKLPKPFKKLPKNDDNWKEVRSQIPGSKVRSEKVPIVYVSEVPAELILTDGMASLEMVPGTRLLWVTNTESDLFLSNEDSRFYYLVSGRWFRSESLEGPWKFATPELPEDFKRIPRNHARSHVRASIPGTEETQEAVILGQIPQKATVERGELNVAVDYQGEPQFHAIEGTSLYYAVNTQNDVIRVGDMYYVCYQAVWFVSASAQGPWEIAENVPDEIYTIPPSSPVYNTTYVRVYDYTPTSVTFGYTSGYWGMYYGWGTMAYGTGWYYPPYYYYDPFYPYPYYYSYPVSYGCSAWYNPNTGTYGRGASVYGPYGGMGRAAAYNPHRNLRARRGRIRSLSGTRLGRGL